MHKRTVNHQFPYTAAPAAAAAARRRPWRVASAADGGGRDTLRSAADATWQPEMNYGSRQLRLALLVNTNISPGCVAKHRVCAGIFIGHFVQIFCRVYQ